MELICIVCPNGCRMTAEKTAGGGIAVAGNRCPRGAQFAAAELTRPMRSLTTTVACRLPGIPVAPVRTGGEIPKEKIPAVMAVCNAFVLTHPVRCGDVLIEDAAGTGCPILATRTLGRRNE
jgi:CxxC motif-containing protein